MLWMVINQFYSNAFKEHKGDTRYLCKLIAKLTGRTSLKPMLECESDVNLLKTLQTSFWKKLRKLELIWINL